MKNNYMKSNEERTIMTIHNGMEIIETIEIKDQDHMFQIWDQYKMTPINISFWDKIHTLGYYKETETVVGIGYTGVKSHIGKVTYREVNGKRSVVDVYATCGSQKIGSGIRLGGDFKEVEVTAERLTCKKCQKAFEKR